MVDKKTRKLLIALPIVLLIVVGLSYTVDGNGDEPSNEGDLGSFTECLNEENVVFYGLDSCPACITQKNMFGDYLDNVEYIECTEQPEECEEAGISSVPEWFIDGERQGPGVRSLEELSEMSGCEL